MNNGLTVEEMARRYVAKAEPCIDGQGGCHKRLFSVACALVKGFDFSPAEARPILDDYNARCVPPWSDAELRHKLTQADGVADTEARGWLRLDITARESAAERDARRERVKPVPPPKPEFDPMKLKTFAGRWREKVDTAWLADRSPVMPFQMGPGEYLRRVYREGERVVVFTTQESQGQALWPLEAVPEGGPDGVWYLAQPVDGEYHPNPRSLYTSGPREGMPKLSRRSEESVLAWRFVVLESDEADARDWMGALVQLPLRIVAIYTSGGRSIHALVEVNAPTKQEWDSLVAQIKGVVVTLGADPKAMTAVRLSRLPGCMRGDRLQKLLYLNPTPQPEPIRAAKRVRDVCEFAETLWKAMEGLSRAEALAAGKEEVEYLAAWVRWFETAPRMKAVMEKMKEWGKV